MTSAQLAQSVWVDGSGRAVPMDPVEDRAHAMDCLGWINVRAAAEGIELWVNPLAAQPRTRDSAVEVAAGLRGRGRNRPLIVKVHDRESRGSLTTQSVEDLSSLIQDSVELTSSPGFPLMQDRLRGCLPTEINDTHVRDTWAFLVASQFRPSAELMERVEATEHRAKIVMAHAATGAVQILAHDRRTPGIWNEPAGFAGRFLHELPIPVPLKRSLRADLMSMLEDRRIVVSFVRGLRRIMPLADATVPDSFFRVTIPLRWHGDALERPALVLISPYG